MKIKQITIVIISLSLLDLIYWIYFWKKNFSQSQSNFLLLKDKYIKSFPNFIRPLYSSTPQIIDVFLFLSLTICVFLLIKNKSNKLLIFFSFILAFRHLFSMM